jgi:hypothetical protein
MSEGYDSDKFILILVEGENASQGAPSQGDLEAYANGKGLVDVPVVADPGWAFSAGFEKDYYIPTSVLAGGGLELIKVDENVMAGDIQQAVDAI